MAKNKGNIPSGGNLPGSGPNMMKQLQKMQQDMADAQAALEHETVEVSVGGGIVTVVITGHQRVQSVAINKEMIDTTEEDWLTDLQDLVVVAINQAIEQSQTMAASRLESITGGLSGMPGLGGLFG